MPSPLALFVNILTYPGKAVRGIGCDVELEIRQFVRRIIHQEMREKWGMDLTNVDPVSLNTGIGL